MEKKYGITWYDTHGELEYAHVSVVAKVATRVAEGNRDSMWLANRNGMAVMVEEKTDNVFADIKVVDAKTCDLTEEELAALDFPVLKIAMPSGRFKLYYPLYMKDRMPWESRHWDEGDSDCYRLALSYYREELGIPLRAVLAPQNYTSEMMTFAKTNLFLDNFQSCGFEQVLFPEVGDAILFKTGLAHFDGPDHCAVYLGNDKFLHHFRNRLSTVQEYTSSWKAKTEMVLRHKERM